MSGTIFWFGVKKIFEVLASLGILAALLFFLLKALPGGPFDEDVALNPIVKMKLEEHWKIDASWFEQAGSYLKAAAQGDLGVSMARPERKVSEIIISGVRSTLLLNLLALGFVILGALLMSTLAIRFGDTWVEEMIDQGVIICLSLPSLFWGPFLIYMFGFYWNLLPIAFLSGPQHFILPLLTLSLRPLAILVRLLKNSMKENNEKDYVRTAKAKGVGTWRILLHHVLRNSLIPFLSYAGPLFVSLLSGSFLVEMLFAIPGLGTEFIASINDRDYTLIVGLTLFYGAFLIIVNSSVDLLIRIVDPRLREEA